MKITVKQLRSIIVSEARKAVEPTVTVWPAKAGLSQSEVRKMATKHGCTVTDDGGISGSRSDIKKLFDEDVFGGGSTASSEKTKRVLSTSKKAEV